MPQIKEGLITVISSIANSVSNQAGSSMVPLEPV